jgi:hypothetical protein
MKQALQMVGAIALLLATACSSKDLSGEWSGTITDSDGAPDPITWSLSQAGAAFSGTARLGTPAPGEPVLAGTVTGTVSDGDMSYTMVLTSGACTLTAMGTGPFTAAQINVSYSAGSNCFPGRTIVGQISLKRR